MILLPLLGATTSAQAQQGSLFEHPRRSDIDSMVAAFYQRRGGQPAWLESARASENVAGLLSALAQAPEDGLDPGNYGMPGLLAVLQSGAEPGDVDHWDKILTRAFLAFASDLSRGRVWPDLVDRDWRESPKALDLVQLLEETLEGGAIGERLQRVAPVHPGYVALREVLGRYRRLEASGGWRALPTGPPLRPGATDPRVIGLRDRLAVEDFVVMPPTGAGDVYDADLEMAVREYQLARGLDPDGVIGPATLASLNTSPADRIRQIAANLERWRWLPGSLDPPYVMVNTAGFVMDLVTDDGTSLTSRAIVGRTDWPTPIVSSMITALVFRPTWSVPRSIAGKELLPLIRRNPEYLAQQGIRVFKGKTEINPADVSWRSVSRRSLIYRFVQDPGPENPLGGVKFFLQTPFGVYLHDTPHQALFAAQVRRFSHGCVRIEQAAALAGILSGWSGDSVPAAMGTGREQWIPLPRAVPVHLVYWTAWVDPAGVLQFRDDGYGWDARLNAALAPSANIAEIAARSTRTAEAQACDDR